jgi:DNA-binding transcriptional ArsR family regulator
MPRRSATPVSSRPEGPGDPGITEEPVDVTLFRDAAETFAMLAAPTRLHLLWLLAHGSRDVTALAEAVGISTATVSQHLAKMRLANLVSARRQGKHQIYEVDDPHVITLLHQALEHHADLRSR